MTTVAVLLVAVVAGVASYDHQRVLADQAGEGWRAWLWPLSVDGLVIAASMSIRTRRWAGEKVGAVPWVSLLAGITASIAANLSVAEPTLVARLVAVWPPLALILAELLVHNNGHHTTRREADHDLLDTPGPPPLADPPASPLRRTR